MSQWISVGFDNKGESVGYFTPDINDPYVYFSGKNASKKQEAAVANTISKANENVSSAIETINKESNTKELLELICDSQRSKEENIINSFLKNYNEVKEALGALNKEENIDENIINEIISYVSQKIELLSDTKNGRGKALNLCLFNSEMKTYDKKNIKDMEIFLKDKNGKEIILKDEEGNEIKKTRKANSNDLDRIRQVIKRAADNMRKTYSNTRSKSIGREFYKRVEGKIKQKIPNANSKIIYAIAQGLLLNYLSKQETIDKYYRSFDADKKIIKKIKDEEGKEIKKETIIKKEKRGNFIHATKMNNDIQEFIDSCENYIEAGIRRHMELETHGNINFSIQDIGHTDEIFQALIRSNPNLEFEMAERVIGKDNMSREGAIDFFLEYEPEDKNDTAKNSLQSLEQLKKIANDYYSKQNEDYDYNKENLENTLERANKIFSKLNIIDESFRAAVSNKISISGHDDTLEGREFTLDSFFNEISNYYGGINIGNMKQLSNSIKFLICQYATGRAGSRDFLSKFKNIAPNMMFDYKSYKEEGNTINLIHYENNVLTLSELMNHQLEEKSSISTSIVLKGRGKLDKKMPYTKEKWESNRAVGLNYNPRIIISGAR